MEREFKTEKYLLDTADVVRVRAVFESSTNADPTIPFLTFTGLDGPNANNSDIIKGESVIGKVSGASALIRRNHWHTICIY